MDLKEYQRKQLSKFSQNRPKILHKINASIKRNENNESLDSELILIKKTPIHNNNIKDNFNQTSYTQKKSTSINEPKLNNSFFNCSLKTEHNLIYKNNLKNKSSFNSDYDNSSQHFNLLDCIDPSISFYKQSLMKTDVDWMTPIKPERKIKKATDIVLDRIKNEKENYIQNKYKNVIPEHTKKEYEQYQQILSTEYDVFSDQIIEKLKNEVCEKSNKDFQKLTNSFKRNFLLAKQISAKVRKNKNNGPNIRQQDFPKEWKTNERNREYWKIHDNCINEFADEFKDQLAKQDKSNDIYQSVDKSQKYAYKFKNEVLTNNNQ